MRWIVAWSLRFRLLTLGIAAALMLFGLTQLPNVPVEAVPEFTPPYVEIQTEALGLSADEVEQLITVPLEADLLQGVAFLDEIRSESIAGLSSIVLIFEPGTDIFRARQVVAERLTQAHALPNVSKAPQMLQPLSSTSRLLMVSLASKDVSLMEMSVLARWTIRPRLLSVPGVANVAVWGMRDRQLQVLVDPARLSEQGLGLQDVIETTGNALWVSPLTYLDASTPGTGGFIDTPNQRLGVHHVFPVRTAEELAQIPFHPEDTSGRIVRLGDVADVVEDHQLLIGDAVVNDGPGLMLVVEKFPNADTLEVTRGVERALAALGPGLGGIQVDAKVFRPATFIEEAVGNLGLALLVGFLLAALSLFAFFRGWRSTLIALVSIVLSVAAGVLALGLLGATINAVIVAGLVLGVAVIVDDAIVVVDDIVGRLRHPRDDDTGRSAPGIIIEAVCERRSATTYAMVIVVLLLLPLLLVTGVAGAFLPSLLLAYLVAITASMLTALTITPALASLLLSQTQSPHRERVLARRLRTAYASLLAGILRQGRTLLAGVALITIGVLAIAGVGALPGTGEPFIPSFRERDLLIHVDGAPGTSSVEMNRIAARAGAELRTIPGVRSVGGQVGRALTSDRVVGINAGELWLSIDPAADYDATLAAVQDVISGYPGLRRVVQTYTADRIDAVLGQTEDDVVVRVYGQDADLLRAKAAEVRQALTEVGGLVDVAVEAQTDEPTLQVEVNLDAAARYGLKPGDVRRIATTLLSGLEVGFIFENQKVFEVVVWGAPELRHSLTSIRGLPIQTPAGPYVSLGDVADVRIAPARSVVKREGVFAYVDVGATVSGRDLGAVLSDVDRRLAEISFPLEYRAEVRGSALSERAAVIRLLVVAAAALIGILLLLQAAFASWRRALVLLVTLPTALVGAVIGATLSDGFLSISVIAGLIAVLAFSVRQGILMVHRYQRLERLPGAEFGPDLILRGAQERLAPVLMTALAVALVMAPFILLGAQPGFEIVRPMAVVILGGLATSTLFALFVVPAVILRTGPAPEPDPATQLVEQPAVSPA